MADSNQEICNDPKVYRHFYVYGFVKYAINPTEFQQFGAPTELNPNNELAQSYKEYKQIRSRDKQLIKKYHQTGGQLDDD